MWWTTIFLTESRIMNKLTKPTIRETLYGPFGLGDRIELSVDSTSMHFEYRQHPSFHGYIWRLRPPEPRVITAAIDKLRTSDPKEVDGTLYDVYLDHKLQIAVGLPFVVHILPRNSAVMRGDKKIKLGSIGRIDVH
jgi:hypothetical protein